MKLIYYNNILIMKKNFYVFHETKTILFNINCEHYTCYFSLVCITIINEINSFQITNKDFFNNIFNIKLCKLSLIPEFFFAFTAIIIIIHCSLIIYNKIYNNILIQFSIISLCILIIILTFFLYFNENLIIIKYISLEFAFFSNFLGFIAKLIIIFTSGLCIYFLQDYLIENKINSIEYELLLLYAILGLTILITANDFGTIFLTLELQSLSIYILSGFKKNSLYSIESGLKYFILGALSAAYFLLGWSLLYGISGLFILLGFYIFFFNIFLKIKINNLILSEILNKIELLLNSNRSIIYNDNNNNELLSMLINSILKLLILFYCGSCNYENNKLNSLENIGYDEYLSLSAEDKLLHLYIVSRNTVICEAEFKSVHCEFCLTLLTNFRVFDEKKIKEENDLKEELLRIYTKIDYAFYSNNLLAKKTPKCWFCETQLENYLNAINEENNKKQIIIQKILYNYEQTLPSYVFHKYLREIILYHKNRFKITPKTHEKIFLDQFFKTCNKDNDENIVNTPVCKYIFEKYKKCWEIEILRETILTKKLHKTCDDIEQTNKTENKMCKAIKNFKKINLESLTELKKQTKIIDKKFISNKKFLIKTNKESLLTQSALILILISFFFKLAIAPFHLWSLDIYEGSLTSSTIFFAVITKFSIIIILIKIFYYGFYNLIINSLYQLLIFVSIFSIFVGSFAGLTERKLKSLLAYSSINNIGYLLLTFSIGTLNAIKTTLFYLIIYLSASLTTWSNLISIKLKKTRYIKKQNKDFIDIILLRKANPILTIIFQISLFSLAGLPPFIGFLTKIDIFFTSIEAQIFLISLITILLSIISTFYYLRLIKITCFEKTLVGKLYKPIKLKQSIINTFLGFFLLYQFFKPSFSIFFSYKIIIC